MIKICEQCSKEFESPFKRAKVCSSECRKTRFNNKTGRLADKSISTGTVGAMSEMVVAVDLMKRGYSVFRALSQSCLCDLVAYKDGKSLLIEVRTGYEQDNGKMFFPTNVRDKGRQDIFGVYERAKDKVEYFDRNRKKFALE